MEEKPKLLAVIRIRGMVGAHREVRETMAYLRLHRNNHMTLVPSTPSYVGMLQKVKDYITWGEISKDVLIKVLEKRGRLVGNKRLTEENVKSLGFNSIEELADALYNLKVKLKDIEGLKPIFRLRPPRKGFKYSIKRPYGSKGETGYRGEAINELILRML